MSSNDIVESPRSTTNTLHRPRHARMKFIVGGALILGAVVYLIATTTLSTAQYYLTVEELRGRGSTVVGKNVRVSGAVMGESIQYDAQALELTFTVAQVSDSPESLQAAGGLAQALAQAVRNPQAARLNVHYLGPKPDLMRPEAQAIMDGQLREDGTFHADTLLLKCPTRYESGPRS